MGCFSCFPKEKRQDIEEDSTERKRRNTNCFSCFQAQSMTQENTRKSNWFSCFQRQKSTHTKKDTTQGKTLETNLIQEKTQKENCLPCFTAQDSAQVKTKRKRRNMNCFSCSATKSKRRNKKSRRFGNCHFLAFPFKNKNRVADEFQDLDVNSPKRAKRNNQSERELKAKKFTFKELATATKNFKEEYLLGEGGFGRVYKGKLEKTGEVVAVKQLNLEGKQGNREFLVEIMILSNLCHPHLVNLVGYCAEGEERLLVYEFMSAGSLENHLLDLPRGGQPLDWSTRIKVALHTAKGLEYLHETNNPPIIYRDLKSSNILLDKEFNAKLSDFGLAKVGPVGSNTHVSSRVMGTFGYCAPEYQKTGKLTVKSDIYSYGVVLLELITGRRAVDLTRDSEELHLVRWVEPRIKDPRKYTEVVDPLLEGNYPRTDLSQVLAIAAMCLGVNASLRPSISDVVSALDSLVQDSDVTS